MEDPALTGGVFSCAAAQPETITRATLPVIETIGTGVPSPLRGEGQGGGPPK